MLGMKQANPAQQPMAPQAQPGAAPADMGSADQGNVTPEEQAEYDAFIRNAHEVIYDQNNEVSPVFIQHLKGEMDEQTAQMFAGVEPPLSGNPVDNLAVASVLLTMFLDSSAAQAGKDIPNDILYHAGVELVEEMAEVADAAGIHDYSEKELEGGFYRALDLFRTASPRVDKDALGEEFAEIANADKNGTLEQMLPGIMQGQQEEPAQESMQEPA